jgi:hypothetical protein
MTRMLPWFVAVPGLIVAAIYLLLTFGDLWRIFSTSGT